MVGANCISDNLIALYRPSQGTKSENHFSPDISFSTLSFSLHPFCILHFFYWPCHLFSPISFLLIVFACLTSAAHPLFLLDSPHWVKDLLPDPDPTHKRSVDNQLPLSSGLNRSSSKFPCHGILSKSGLLPIIPHLLRHSSLIFGCLIPASFGCVLSHPAVTRWPQFSLKWSYCYLAYRDGQIIKCTAFQSTLNRW